MTKMHLPSAPRAQDPPSMPRWKRLAMLGIIWGLAYGWAYWIFGPS